MGEHRNCLSRDSVGEIERQVLECGEGLTPEQILLARRVGVSNPEAVDCVYFAGYEYGIP